MRVITGFLVALLVGGGILTAEFSQNKDKMFTTRTKLENLKLISEKAVKGSDYMEILIKRTKGVRFFAKGVASPQSITADFAFGDFQFGDFQFGDFNFSDDSTSSNTRKHPLFKKNLKLPQPIILAGK
jgi:hypothetical protein